MHERHLTASALLASALLLTACGGGTDTAAGTATSGSTASSAAPDTAKGNDADMAFLAGMKPHHEQAVEMSDMVLAADPPEAVAAVARKIKDAQSPEIEQMTDMLTDLGQDSGDTSHMGGHSSGMTGHGGMMSDADMDALMNATGTDAARLYLQGLVRHHQGAIEASDVEIAQGQYAPAVELAEKIKAAQTTEITEMQALLKSV